MVVLSVFLANWLHLLKLWEIKRMERAPSLSRAAMLTSCVSRPRSIIRQIRPMNLFTTGRMFGRHQQFTGWRQNLQQENFT